MEVRRESIIGNILGRALTCEEKVLLDLASPLNASGTETVSYAEKFDAQQFHALVTRHKVAPSVFLAKHTLLDELPAQVTDQLKQQANRIVRRMLFVSREMVEIEKQFRNKGVSVLFLKGPALAMQLFGDVGKRYSVDIDILVAKNDLDEVGYLLKSLNYQAVKSEEGKNFIVKKLFRYAKKDRTYKKDGSGIPIEVHYRLFPNSTYDKQEKQLMHSHIGHVLLAGEKIQVLDLPLHFLFLAAHGSVHQWFQLFWLRDIAEIIHTGKISDWNALMVMANEMGLQRPVVLAVHLSHLVFGTSIPPQIGIAMKDKPQLHLRDACVQTIFYPLHENLQRRIKRVWYLSMLDGSLRYKWNTFLGGAGRFLLEG